MIKNNKNNKKHIYFIGIGGVSMSALATFAMTLGYKVSGSDLQKNTFTQSLAKKGAVIFRNHHCKNVADDVNIIVYTGAINKNNEELLEGKKRGLVIYERSQFLGYIASMYSNVIAISGTHGKTTTTAMLGDIFINGGLNPTIHLGGESESFDGNLVVGGKEFFITEACEYRNSFHYIAPTTSVVTNIEKDHMDYYFDINEINNAFYGFVNPSEQHIVVFENNKFANTVNCKSKVVSCGFNGNYDVVGYNVQKDKFGHYSFDVKYNNNYIARFSLNVIGLHNAKNALCAITVALLYNVKIGSIYTALKNFKGVLRRYEKIGEYKNITVIADYAHHPTEIKNSILGALTTHKKILCIFQPHTYSRTKSLMKEFKNCFKGVHKLVIYKTYEAREKYIPGGSGISLMHNVTFSKNRKFYCDTQKCLITTLQQMDNDYDLVLVLGAGNIYDIMKKVLIKLFKMC